MAGEPRYIFVWLALLCLARVDVGVGHSRSSGLMEAVYGMLNVDILVKGKYSQVVNAAQLCHSGRSYV